MSEILVTRRFGRHRAGDVVEADVDAYWKAHLESGNARLLEPAGEEVAPAPDADEADAAAEDSADDDDSDDDTEEDTTPPSWLSWRKHEDA